MLPPASRSKTTLAHSRPFHWGWLLVLLLLLIGPSAALVRSKFDQRWLLGGAVGINLLTFGAYVHDKRRAREQGWRLPEARLHLLELLGGWPAALLAQRWWRHKCSKLSYQIIFWLIVGVWQFAAVDSVQNWRYSRVAGDWIAPVIANRSR